MDLKTQAIVLRRVDYGEADRILDILTPEGKQSVIAKGARREKSKMAGGIELFSVSDVVVRRKREGGMGILSSVRLKKYYGDVIVGDFEKIEFGYEVLRDMSKYSEGVEGGEYFDMLAQVLDGMGVMPLSVLRAWFRMNILRVNGEGVNLWRDVESRKLEASLRYDWDLGAGALRETTDGEIGADEIKMMRLLVSSRLSVAARVREMEKIWDLVERITRVS